MSDDCWKMLRELMTAVDSHRLSNPEPTVWDVQLYSSLAEMRRRLA